MCGIAGFQGSFSSELLDEMRDVVAHRGPDGAGSFLSPASAGRPLVGLAHRRLSIIDLSAAGDQPMGCRCNRCGAGQMSDLALIYNGELYNFPELRRELLGRGHTFSSATDSEILLHLYAEEGTAMLQRLNGIFAFAIYDGRPSSRPHGIEQGDVFVARDQIGVKPLYYSVVPEGVLFGSEIKSLLKFPGLSREIDLIALHQHLAYLWTPAPRTMLRDVKKLRPGCAMVLRGGMIAREWSYYDLPYGRAPLDAAEGEIALELHEKLEAAVRRQLISDVPVGAFLSGGLDSSAVVAMMKRVAPNDSPTCYSIGFRGDGDVEGNPADLPYARLVAKHLGVKLREIVVEPGIIDRLEDMLYHLDEPQADPAPINALIIAEHARVDGIKVLMSGAGGDDIFSGYRRHQALRVERFSAGIPTFARRGVAAVARSSASGSGIGARSHWARRVVKMLEHADLQGDDRLAAYFQWGSDRIRRGLYSEDFTAAVSTESAASPLLSSLQRIPGERDGLNRMLYLETKHFLADHNLNYTDKMGMAAGVEVRVPLVDLDLVEFAARIPSELKQKGALGKSIFKKAMEPDLPHNVIYRKKSGFGAPLREWLRTELRERVDDTLSPASLRRRGLFDPDAVERFIALDREGRIDGAYTIFALMCFELWCRLFIDN